MPINNPSTYLWMAISKAVPAESYHPASVIARQSFGITIQPRLPGGYVDSNYRGNIRIYANSPSSDTAFLIGGVYRSAGDTGFTYASATISSVYNESSFRKITLVDDDGKTVSMNVGVWFQGKITQFTIPAGRNPACGSNYPSNYAALPSSNRALCGKNIVVANQSNNRIANAVVYDVGPWVPYKNCGSDPYWNNGTVPWAQQHEGEKRCTLCGCDAGAPDYTVNGAILDVAPSVLSAVGASGTLTNGVWRFT
ncbi:hypothetical protein [Paenibacillus sp. 32O-W]|uniref:hypothetical protein n=1 Tax=Paenibacillus sp. 32O-W TaxID=1695218 RepID=UPI0011A809CB|nr:MULTISPECIES: hypothetical protein [Paenibacillaceae]